MSGPLWPTIPSTPYRLTIGHNPPAWWNPVYDRPSDTPATAQVWKHWSDAKPVKPMNLLLNICLLLTWLVLAAGASAGEAVSDGYVGRAACAECHAQQAGLWRGSHHDLAMQEATAATVLGDFDDASVTQYGITSTFHRKNGRFMVRTEGADGTLQDFEIRYTFGAEPLQQYLVAFPGGRLQALGLAWDARPKEEGGQRWFHLYPDEQIPQDDELHWTRPSQNWNSMCAECHSTHLQKNYDPASETFATTWSEIDVSCEACHGPGANHVAWAGKTPEQSSQDPARGLVVRLDERKGIRWSSDPETGRVARSSPRTTDREIEMCARCHARRSPITREYVAGEPLLDHYLPRLLQTGLYHPDGQIDDEVYVYGSFLQSRMYAAGVSCSDCHEPHSLALRVPGNGVCLQCHAAKKYDSAAHHFHDPDSAGGRCAECHMPAQTYMVVDPRHDHSLRIPRPDLSVTLGTPNACTNCHDDRPAAWAAGQVREWYGGVPKGYQHYADALAAARRGEPAAGRALAQLARDSATPDIARATALAGLGPYLGPETIQTLVDGLYAEDANMRAGALQGLENAPAELRLQLVFPALEDPLRAVRIEAARLLAPLRRGELTDGQRAKLDRGLQEYIESQQAMAERPQAQLNLGNLHAELGDYEQALAAYRTALELNPDFVPAWVNQADLQRARGEEAAAEKLLRKATQRLPESGDLHHALGLSLVRQQRTAEALEELRQAARLAPDNARYIYVYGVALNSTGAAEQALLVLQGAHNRFPNNTDILAALVALHRERGNTEAAQRYADRLRALTAAAEYTP
jgi:predicted CXXCH cytochrome family protein